MLNRNKNGLLIFDDFNTDYGLQKHNKKGNYVSSDMVSFNEADMPDEEPSSIGGNTSLDGRSGGNFINPSDFDFVQLHGEGLTISASAGKSVFKRVKDFFNNKKKEEVVEPKPTITIADFFKSLKSSAINIEQYSARSNDYINAYKYAKQLNQAALVSELKSKIDQAKYESILFASGFKTIITEEQVVKFYKESPKGLEMTWIRNFIRIIPDKAASRKMEADKLNVFDNYVILHYDPKKKAFMEEEKDPILFGVISGVRKLYYIADWVDEYCDLTLEQFIDRFGDEAIKANDLTVNYKL
jgi:hypothetical protein